MKRLTMLGVLFLLAGGMMAYADIVPYSDPAGQGTQNWGGNLALTFNVNSPISVNSLGVFNASGTGLITGFIHVAIFDTVTGVRVTPEVIFHGQYVHGAQGYDVFQGITPVVLGPGSYEVDAFGFSSTDKNGNLNTGSSSGPALNDLGGQITFTGAAWDSNTSSLDHPTSCATCKVGSAQWRQFDAGTLTVPEPGFYAALGGLWAGMAGLLLVVRRRKGATVAA
jgi:hypothetical protein